MKLKMIFLKTQISQNANAISATGIRFARVLARALVIKSVKLVGVSADKKVVAASNQSQNRPGAVQWKITPRRSMMLTKKTQGMKFIR